MNATPNPAYKAEDKIIMAARALLEQFWTNNVPGASQAAWRTRWLTRPPFDITLKQYVPYTPTHLNQVKVTEPVAYAWSQIYGAYRYSAAPVVTPTAYIDNGILLSQFDPHTTTLPFNFDVGLGLTYPLPFIVFASALVGPGQQGGRATVRPMCFNRIAAQSGTVDFLPCWTLRQGKPPAGNMTATAGYVNPNNELVPSRDLLQAVVEDP